MGIFLLKNNIFQLAFLIIALRAASILGRIGLIYYLGSTLLLSEVGYFSLIQATLAFGIIVGGLEFHAYSTREIATASLETIGGLLASFLITTSSILIGTGIIISAYFSFTPTVTQHESHLGTYLLLTITFLWIISEYFCTEAYRVMIALGKPLQANIGMFIRNGSWPLLLLLLDFITHLNGLMFVFGFAIAAGWVALLYYVIVFRHDGVWPQFPSANFKWIYIGLKVCLPLWAGVLVARASYIIDRWIVGSQSSELLGIYTLWISATLLIQVFFEATCTSMFMSKLLRTKSENSNTFTAAFRQFSVLGTTMIVLAVALLVMCFPLLSKIFGNAKLLEYYHLYVILLLASATLTASLIPQIYLYVCRKDRSTIILNCLSTAVFGVVVIGGGDGNAAMLVALAHLCASIFLLLSRGGMAIYYAWS